MSCRVLGRGIEWSFWERSSARAVARRRTIVRAEYLPTAKNAQVRDFWDRLGLELSVGGRDGPRSYHARLGELQLAAAPARSRSSMISEDQLQAAVAAMLDIDPGRIGPETSTDTVPSGTRCKHMNLVIALEEAFGITIPDDEVAR